MNKRIRKKKFKQAVLRNMAILIGARDYFILKMIRDSAIASQFPTGGIVGGLREGESIVKPTGRMTLLEYLHKRNPL